MNKYALIALKYPGLIAIDKSLCIPFFHQEEKYAFFIGSISRGVTVHDPNNEFFEDAMNDVKLKVIIDAPRDKYVEHTVLNKDGSAKFYTILEMHPNTSRTYYDKPYTELFLLIDGKDDSIKADDLKRYLSNLFTRYNSSYMNSSIPNPDGNHWDESILVSQCLFQHEATFETIITSPLDWKLKYNPALVMFSSSRYGIIPESYRFINDHKDIPPVPEKYFDVFELFASGVMQLNHFKNSKLALLETFVSVEVLIIRIIGEIKEAKGISKKKLKEFSKSVDLSYKMEIELRLFFTFNEEEEDMLRKVVKARSIRNGIMHSNKLVDKGEVRSHIKDIRDFLFMLIQKHEPQKL